MQVERELKFSLLDDHFPSKFELAPNFLKSGYRLVADGFQKHKDIYFDDVFRSLNKANWGLRKRKLKTKTLATLKERGSTRNGLTEREEIEAEFLTDWPPAIQSKLLGITFHDVKPILELEVTRTQYRIFDEFKHVATLYFDDVHANYPDSDYSVQFSEAELEAEENTPTETLHALAELVDPVTRLNPNSSTKLERAVALLGLAESM